MAIVQPQATDTTISGDHAHLHRVLAVDSSAPNESIVVGSTGNVGIGTSSPVSPLTVLAPQTWNANANSGLVVAGSIGGSNPQYLNLAYDPTNNIGVIRADRTGSGGYESDLALQPLGGDVYSAPWTDYSASSTIVGWSSISVKTIFVKKVGKTVFVNYDIEGVSNSTSTSFTVPYEATNNVFAPIAWTEDNSGGVAATWGILSGSTFISQFTATASGTKKIFGQFFYQSA